MATVTKNITINQGATYTEIFNFEVLTDPTLPWNSLTNPYIPLNYAGYTARMDIRKTFDDASAVIQLTSTAGIILGSLGKLTISLTAAQTAAISFKGESVEYVYDLELVNGSTVIRPVQGTVTITRNVTR